MILQRLAEYADNHLELPPPMYEDVEIRWLINLSEDGELKGFLRRNTGEKVDDAGKLAVPFIRRAAGIKPRLLADNGEYVLCDLRRDSSPPKVEKVLERHSAFVDLTRECVEATENNYAEAILKFLDEWAFDESLVPQDLEPTDNLTFLINDYIPAVESHDVQEFWSNRSASKKADDKAPAEMICLVSGKPGRVEERMPVPVKGLLRIGGKAENSLVSANAPAFKSYGLENSLTSPISRDAAERFGKALNHLLSDRESHIYIGGTLAYTWWTRKESGFSLRLVSEPEDDPQAVYHLMDSARVGKVRQGSEAEKFYALALSASGGRAVVRDWLETTIPEAEANLGRWFRAQEIVDAYGKEMQPLGVFRLAAAAYRDATKEMQPSIPAAMIRVALNGGRLPDDLLARAVRRNIVGTNYPNSETTEHVTRERAALLKIIFTTQGRMEMDEMKSLESDSSLEGVDKAAYSCGRLLAELEQIQREALGKNINATLVDRYYGAASTTPGKVFGLLVGNAQDHLSKIRKSRGGTYDALQRKLEEIMAPMTTYPTSFDVGQQGLFALGYYHQRAENRAAARAPSEAKKNDNQSNDGEEN